MGLESIWGLIAPGPLSHLDLLRRWTHSCLLIISIMNSKMLRCRFWHGYEQNVILLDTATIVCISCPCKCLLWEKGERAERTVLGEREKGKEKDRSPPFSLHLTQNVIIFLFNLWLAIFSKHLSGPHAWPDDLINGPKMTIRFNALK
jgi:hypothetical protein